MRNSRAGKHHVLQLTGHIVIEGMSYPCVVYDKSKNGARLILNYDDMKLPPQFLIQANSAAQPCWLIWQEDREAAVAFSKPDA